MWFSVVIMTRPVSNDPRPPRDTAAPASGSTQRSIANWLLQPARDSTSLPDTSGMAVTQTNPPATRVTVLESDFSSDAASIWGPRSDATESTVSRGDTSVPDSQATLPEFGCWDQLSAKSKSEMMGDLCVLDPSTAQAILNRSRTGTFNGWCELSSMKPTKAGGYIQLSFGGANKFATLGSVLLWAQGGTLAQEPPIVRNLVTREDGTAEVSTEAPPPLQVSHRCGEPRCMTIGHVTPETALMNNARKGCLVWVPCHHCHGKVLVVCGHTPVCIKYHNMYTSMEDLLTRGVCGIADDSEFTCPPSGSLTG